MRWSIIRLIWLRELRDQMRDRRTLITILALPLLLYPALSILVLQFAAQLLNRPSTIGIVGGDTVSMKFPLPAKSAPRHSPQPIISWLSLTPTPVSMGMDRFAGSACLAQTGHVSLDYFLLLENGEIPGLYRKERKERLTVFPGDIEFQFRFLDGPAEDALADKEVDLVVSATPGFMDRVVNGEEPVIKLVGRQGDDRSRRAAEQMMILLGRWKQHLKEVRLRRAGLSPRFDQPFTVDDVNKPANEEILAAETLLDLMVRTFPFMLVMWSLVGALHPAIDLCAGEKERGTMETLLISPAGRAEIVYGKFLTIWVFSAGTAIMHLLSMSVATWQLREHLPQGAVTLPAFFWCVLLVLPLSALFSAVSLAVGAYARSSREGQYYLMPMFWLTMPLLLITFMPDVELNQFYSMVPVTGVALLMQRLMITPSLASVPWFYFLPVFGSMMLWSWLALRWAIWQFQREEVLFRAAERLHLGMMFRNLFRRTEASPSFGQAMICFAVLFTLRWLSLDLGIDVPLMTRTTIIVLAFVAAPPLFMGLLLTTKPRSSLSLRLPHPGFVLAALLLLPLAEMVHIMLSQFPSLAELFRDRRSFVEEAFALVQRNAGNISWPQYVLVLGFLPALSKEIAFRGFILNGLRQRMPVWPAVFFSSLLFAVYHMNVFALLPFFLLGLVCGTLAVRSGSLLPGIVLHTGCNILLLRAPMLTEFNPLSALPAAMFYSLLVAVTLLCTVLVSILVVRLKPVDQNSSNS